jgi:hypothetical protein
LVAVAVTEADPAVFDVTVMIHEPPVPVVQVELDSTPRFVETETMIFAWLLEVCIVMVEVEKPSDAT